MTSPQGRDRITAPSSSQGQPVTAEDIAWLEGIAQKQQGIDVAYITPVQARRILAALRAGPPSEGADYPHTGPHRDDPALLREAVVECLTAPIAKLADDPCAPTLGGLLIHAWQELNVLLEEANTELAKLRTASPVVVNCPDCGKPMAQARQGEAVFLCANLDCNPRRLKMPSAEWLKRKILAEPDLPCEAGPVSPARAKFDTIMADIPKAGCVHGIPFTDLCERCVASDEFDPLTVLDFCEGAIRDAIGLDDGLDGAAGEGVLSMIRTARARAVRVSAPASPVGTEDATRLPTRSEVEQAVKECENAAISYATENVDRSRLAEAEAALLALIPTQETRDNG